MSITAAALIGARGRVALAEGSAVGTVLAAPARAELGVASGTPPVVGETIVVAVGLPQVPSNDVVAEVGQPPLRPTVDQSDPAPAGDAGDDGTDVGPVTSSIISSIAGAVAESAAVAWLAA